MPNGTVPARPGFDQAALDNAFTYHAPRGDQVDRYVAIRGDGLALATRILQSTPRCPEQTLAIQKVREAVMWANAAIACQEKPAS